MTKYVFDKEQRKMVELDSYYEAPVRVHIINDCLPTEGLIHPATGKRMYSRSEFQKMTRAAGCIEVGNEVQKDRREWGVPNLTEDIRESLERSRSR